jgi:hypothetical protein
MFLLCYVGLWDFTKSPNVMIVDVFWSTSFWVLLRRGLALPLKIRHTITLRRLKSPTDSNHRFFPTAHKYIFFRTRTQGGVWMWLMWWLVMYSRQYLWSSLSGANPPPPLPLFFPFFVACVGRRHIRSIEGRTLVSHLIYHCRWSQYMQGVRAKHMRGSGSTIYFWGPALWAIWVCILSLFSVNHRYLRMRPLFANR